MSAGRIREPVDVPRVISVARVAAMVVLGLSIARVALHAQIQMPDPSQMAGIPRPVDDLPDGTVSVRLIRGQLSNNITDYPVEMHLQGATAVRTASTDETGRASFAGLPAGALVHAVAVVDGERLESQEFPVPARGGIRVMLVAATRPGAAEPSRGNAAPAPSVAAQPGSVSLGGNTRFIVEITDDGLQIYYVLDLVNSAQTPVSSGPVVFRLPVGAQGATVLEGSTPAATMNGTHLTIAGPFQPGSTAVQMAFIMPTSGGEQQLAFSVPVALPALGVVVRKIGAVTVESAQATNRQEMTTPEGQSYFILNGQGIPAGGEVTLNLSGLPHHSAVPFRLTVALVMVILIAGTWTACRSGGSSATTARRRQLRARREQLFGSVVKLEEQRRTGQIDASRFAVRRNALIVQLERVYGELDAGGGVTGGDEGLAA